MTLPNPPRARAWRLAAVTLAGAAVLGATAFGAVSALADDAPGMHQPMTGEHGPQRMFDHFKAKLKLTPTQAALWDQAVAKMRPPAATIERMRASHEQYRAALMDSSFDPHKWVAEQDKDRAEREAHMKDSRTAWLAVWDSLDAAQRTQVREFLFARADHEHRGHWAHHEDQHGEEGHGMPGAAGPAKQ